MNNRMTEEFVKDDEQGEERDIQHEDPTERIGDAMAVYVLCQSGRHTKLELNPSRKHLVLLQHCYDH